MTEHKNYKPNYFRTKMLVSLGKIDRPQITYQDNSVKEKNVLDTYVPMHKAIMKKNWDGEQATPAKKSLLE
jgi:hypothetical protein